MAREACEYIYSFFPGLEDKLSIDEFMVERAQRQDELFRRVPAMTGAVRLVRHLVSRSGMIARSRYWTLTLVRRRGAHCARDRLELPLL